MKKIGNIILIALLAVAAISVLVWLLGPSIGGPDAVVDPMLLVAAGFLVIAAALLVVLTLMNMGKSRSNSRAGLYVFGGLAVLAVIFYFVMAKSVTVVGADGTVFDDAFTLKITDTMLYLAYAAMGITVLSLIVGEIRKALK
ncbi:MAG: hypothetical protein LBV18_05570 [Alistipes sp.]|jgi:hypothetical protein|nr:hypothetical protein [Alistipes sp.]